MKIVWETICDNQFSVEIYNPVSETILKSYKAVNNSTQAANIGIASRLQNSCKRRESSSIAGHLELKRRKYREHKHNSTCALIRDILLVETVTY